MLLSENNIKSELSYAVLHAVAAKAGFACEVTGRHTDGMGIDAVIRIKERFAADSVLTEFTLDFQLKSTSRNLPFEDGCYSYSLRAHEYDKLRSTSIDSPRYLAILMLPADNEQWLEKTAERLICRKCVRWASLHDAPEGNDSATTIYIDDEQVLTPDALRYLAEIRSREEWIDYPHA